MPGIGAPTAATSSAAPLSVTIAPPAPAPVAIPEGYRAAWRDGRLNPNRGPQTAYGDAQMAATVTIDEVPMRTADPAPARGLIGEAANGAVYSSRSPATQPVAAAPAANPTGYRYVQVGMFNVPDNATRAAAKLRSLGLQGRVARTASGKTVVISGPYDQSAALNAALAKARGAFPDAFLRN